MHPFTTEKKSSDAFEVRWKILISKEVQNEDFGEVKGHKLSTKELQILTL